MSNIVQNYDFTNISGQITPGDGPWQPSIACYINLERIQMVPKSLNLMPGVNCSCIKVDWG